MKAKKGHKGLAILIGVLAGIIAIFLLIFEIPIMPREICDDVVKNIGDKVKCVTLHETIWEHYNRLKY